MPAIFRRPQEKALRLEHQSIGESDLVSFEWRNARTTKADAGH